MNEYVTWAQATELAKRLVRLEKQQRSSARAHADLRHSAIDGGPGMKRKDADGNVLWEMGDTGVEHKTGPVPAQPSAPFVDVGPRVIKVQHSGLDVYEDPAPADFKVAEVHVSQDADFVPTLSTFATNLDSANGSVTHSLPAGEWYVGVVWVTLSNQRSPMSELALAEAEPVVDADQIEADLDDAHDRIDTADAYAQDKFSEYDTKHAEHVTAIDDAKTRITAAEDAFEPIPARIEAAERNVEEARDTATEASAAAIEANNRAMTRLANGNFENDLIAWTYENVTLSSTAHSGTQAAQIGANGWLYQTSSFPVVANQIWEVSLYYQHDTTVTFVSVYEDGTRTTLSTHHLDGDSAWSDSGALRVTIPADVHMLSFTITGTSAIVDDITLRDVTDVVRLEEAANANRQKAEQAISELAVLQLAVDGEGGLKDRLQSAETVLETKADTSALDQLDQKLRTDLAAFEAHYTRIWRQPTPPPAGTSYEWAGAPHASESIKRDPDGNEVARNIIVNGTFELGTSNWTKQGAADQTIADGVMTVVPDGDWYQTLEKPDVDSVVIFRAKGESLRSRWGASQFPSIQLTDEYEWYSTTLTPVGNFNLIFQGDAKITHIALIPGEYDGPHFDGDTASDRANDLWYNSDGVPHEWVNGEGWVELSDARITELANTVTAHATRLSDAETELGKKATTTALNALAGTVAGNTTAIGEAQQTLQDAQDDLGTALTGPVDHDRLRAGEGAFNQAFIARLVADSVQSMSAEFANLTVTEKANFAQIIGDQIWAELAVFDRLDAREGYVGGAHLKDGAVTAEKMTITGDLAAAIVSADKARIAELISDEIWAELGVFDRLQAREGWIGGTNLADGAITAEKIHATREMVTKIMGAEWAYIAEQLIVDGSILTRDLEALSAAIQSLTVTQRADIAELWAEELWTALAVVEELQAEEAWITSAMISELTAEKVTVTENFVGRVAELLHLVVDRIDANQLWADQTWQAAGHFGSDSADQSTRVDGTGLRITKHDHENETSTDIVRLGGEGIGLTFSDEETKEITGSLSPDGDASLKNMNVNHLTMGGRSLQDEECDDYYHPSGDQSLLTFRPRGVEAFHHRQMPAVNSDYREWGFLDVTATLHVGRMYRIILGPVYTFADNTTNQLRIRYTDDGTVARIISPILRRVRYGTQSGQHGSPISGEWYFTPDHSGQHSFLATIYNGQGVRLPAGYTGVDGHCWLVVEDVGLAPTDRMGQDRSTLGSHKTSGINNEDSVGGIETYTTTWEATWFQTYRNNGNTRVPAGDRFGEYVPVQGYRALVDEYYTAMFGFAGATDSSNTTELGQTFQAALAGATIRSVVLEMTGVYSGGSTNTTFYRPIRENHTSPPSTYTYVVSENRWINDYRIDVGQTRRIILPSADYGERFRNGELTSFGLSAIGNPDTRYHGGIAWHNPELRPRITITYQR